MRRFVILGLAGILLSLAGCGSHSVELLGEARPFERRAPLNLSLSLPAGKTQITRGSPGHLYDLRFSYCRTHYRARSRFEPAGDPAEPGGGAARLRIDAQPTLRERRTEEEPNLLDLRLRPGIPLDLRLATGGEAQMDLTGLSVRRLILHAGDGAASVVFKAGNPVDLELLRVTGGTGPLTLAGLGWGQVKSLQFHGGAGMARLDFSGPGPAEAAALLDPGTGGVELSFPADLGVEIAGRDLSLKSPPAGFVETSGAWVSDNRDRAERHLTMLVEGGSEALTIQWLR